MTDLSPISIWFTRRRCSQGSHLSTTLPWCSCSPTAGTGNRDL